MIDRTRHWSREKDDYITKIIANPQNSMTLIKPNQSPIKKKNLKSSESLGVFTNQERPQKNIKKDIHKESG